MRRPVPILAALAVLAGGGTALPALADTVAARCEIMPAGAKQPSVRVPCAFSQRQGFVTIRREDGVTYELSPSGDRPGNYRDAAGQPAYRQALPKGPPGHAYRLARETVYVYWDPAESEASAAAPLAATASPADAVPAPDPGKPAPGSYGFDWLHPQKARCEKMDALLPKFKACEHNTQGGFDGATESYACKLGKAEYVVFKDQKTCKDQREIMEANAP